MSQRRARIAAVGMLAVFILGLTGGAVLAVGNGNLDPAGVSILVGFAAFMIVGALVVSRRPDNSVGWIFCAAGLLLATGWLAQEYAEYAYLTRPGSLPGAIAAIWYANWYWFALLGSTFVFTTLLFPTGRP